MVWLVVFVAGLWLQVASRPTSTFKECYTVDDNKHCFKTELGVTKKWADAQRHCQDTDGSYTLLVNNRHIHNALVQFMELADIIRHFVWIGVTQTTEGEWYWIDETKLTGKLSAGHRFTREEIIFKVTHGRR